MNDERKESDERDERGAEKPSEQGEAEPTPGEDGGPMGNPAQDEEALSKRQQESSDD